jgi:hypothetical protein
MPSHPSTVVRKMSRLSLAPAECRGPSLAMHPPCGGEAGAVRNRATDVPVLLPACRLRRE